MPWSKSVHSFGVILGSQILPFTNHINVQCNKTFFYRNLKFLSFIIQTYFSVLPDIGTCWKVPDKFLGRNTVNHLTPKTAFYTTCVKRSSSRWAYKQPLLPFLCQLKGNRKGWRLCCSELLDCGDNGSADRLAGVRVLKDQMENNRSHQTKSNKDIEKSFMEILLEHQDESTGRQRARDVAEFRATEHENLRKHLHRIAIFVV